MNSWFLGLYFRRNYFSRGLMIGTDIALLKAVALFAPKRCRCKPTRIPCAWCVRSHRMTHPYTHCHIVRILCTEVIRTRTTNRMRRPDGLRMRIVYGGIVSCDVTHSEYGWVFIQRRSFFGVNNSTALSKAIPA